MGNHWRKMLLKFCLLLSLFVCLGSTAPSGLLRQKRQLIGGGVSGGFFRNQQSGVAGTSNAETTNRFASSSSSSSNRRPTSSSSTSNRRPARRGCRDRRGRPVRCG